MSLGGCEWQRPFRQDKAASSEREGSEHVRGVLSWVVLHAASFSSSASHSDGENLELDPPGAGDWS